MKTCGMVVEWSGDGRWSSGSWSWSSWSCTINARIGSQSLSLAARLLKVGSEDHGPTNRGHWSVLLPGRTKCYVTT
jgi:hypothetical protein